MGNQTERQRDIGTDSMTDRELKKLTYRQTHKLDWTPLGSFGNQCGYNAPLRWTSTLVILIEIVIISSIKTNEYKYKNRKTPIDNRIDRWTDKHIILPLS